jgi:acyl dehydratase
MDDAMSLIGNGFYWDDLPLGKRFRTQRRTVTEADLVQFVNLTWLTEELFTCAEGREDMLLAGRVVPAALVYAFAEGLLLPAMQGTGLAFLGAELNVNESVLVGDTIHVECEVIDSRASSKPGRGLVRTLNRVVKQNGQAALTYNPLRMLRARAAATEP